MSNNMKKLKLKKAKVPAGWLRITARSSVKERGHFFIDAMIPVKIGADLISFIEAIPKHDLLTKIKDNER